MDPTGVLVGYSARSGTLAQDGDGRNSPYAEALLTHIEEPGLELGKMFRKIRDDVYQATDGLQEPFVYGSLPGRNIYLVPSALQDADAETTQSAALSDQNNAADALLEKAMATENAEAKLALLKTLAQFYPDTPAGKTARYVAEALESSSQLLQTDTPVEDNVAVEADVTETAALESSPQATETPLD